MRRVAGVLLTSVKTSLGAVGDSVSDGAPPRGRCHSITEALESDGLYGGEHVDYLAHGWDSVPEEQRDLA